MHSRSPLEDEEELLLEELLLEELLVLLELEEDALDEAEVLALVDAELEALVEDVLLELDAELAELLALLLELEPPLVEEELLEEELLLEELLELEDEALLDEVPPEEEAVDELDELGGGISKCSGYDPSGKYSLNP